jgi:hypothetical protein
MYVAVDGSEACLSLNPSKAFCAQKGTVNEVKLELKFSRYETYEDRVPLQGTAGIYHSGKRIRKTNLTAFHFMFLYQK